MSTEQARHALIALGALLLLVVVVFPRGAWGEVTEPRYYVLTEEGERVDSISGSATSTKALDKLLNEPLACGDYLIDHEPIRVRKAVGCVDPGPGPDPVPEPPIVDSDGDGVPDDIDQCADTPSGVAVTDFGCELDLSEPAPLPTPEDPPAPDPVPDPVEPPAVVTPPPGPVVTGGKFEDCANALYFDAEGNPKTTGGMCEINYDIRKQFRESVPTAMGGNLKDRAMLDAYNNWVIIFEDGEIKVVTHGGGHDDSGLSDVHLVNLSTGIGQRIYTAPDYNCVVKGIKGKDNATAWTLRHTPEIVESTHTYDGKTYDKTTGGMLVLTGYKYTSGYRIQEKNPWPDKPMCEGSGRGLYFFNLTDNETKQTQPKRWRRLMASPFDNGKVASAQLPDGRFVFGDYNTMAILYWDGDDMVVDESTRVTVDKADVPVLEVIGDRLFRVNRRHIEEFTFDLKKVRRWPIDVLVTGDAQYAFAPYGDQLLIWNTKNRVVAISPDGSWERHTYNVQLSTTNRGYAGLYGKWTKVPWYNDLYIGWASAMLKPVVYRHDPSHGVPQTITRWTEPTLQEQVDQGGSEVVIATGVYEQGPKVIGPKTVDFQYTQIHRAHNNGLVTAEAGPGDAPVVLKNIKSRGAPAVWGQNERNVPEGQPVGKLDITVDGFDVSNAHFGIITSSYLGGAKRVQLMNGVVTDGGNPGNYGKEHNYYIGYTPELFATNIKSIRAHGGGHLGKFRSIDSLIEDSLFDGEDSNHSRAIDFSCGGTATLRRVVVRGSPNAENNELLSMGPEYKNVNCKTKPTKHTLIFEDVVVESRIQREASKWGKGDHKVTAFKGELTYVCRGTNNVFINIPDPCPKPGDPGAVCETVDGVQECRITHVGADGLIHNDFR